jgi:hypothetical protein
VYGAALAGGAWQRPQKLHVGVALLLEVVEGIFGVGFAIEVEVHLRIVGLELRHLFVQKPVDAHAVAMAFTV